MGGGGAVLGLIFKWRWSYKMFGNQCVLYISVKNNYLKTQKTGDFVLPKNVFLFMFTLWRTYLFKN